MPVDVPSLVVVGVLGPLLLASYGVLVSKQPRDESYTTSPLWLGLGSSTATMLAVFQALAAVGFLVAIGTWALHSPPDGGVLSRHPAVLPATLATLLLSSIAWALLMAFYPTRRDAAFKAAVSGSLIVVAAATVLLLAGAAEERRPRWWVVLGLLLLAHVTVLGDGVVWNARWLIL